MDPASRGDGKASTGTDTNRLAYHHRSNSGTTPVVRAPSQSERAETTDRTGLLQVGGIYCTCLLSGLVLWTLIEVF